MAAPNFSKACRGSDEVIIHSVKNGGGGGGGGEGEQGGLNYLNLKMLSMNLKKSAYFSPFISQPLKGMIRSACVACVLF